MTLSYDQYKKQGASENVQCFRSHKYAVQDDVKLQKSAIVGPL